MPHADLYGLTLSAPSAEAARAFDAVVDGYLRYRADTPARLARLLEVGEDMVMAHVVKGYMMMLAFKEAVVPFAREAHATASKLPANSREKAHIAALGRWIAGDADAQLRIWEQIVAEHPHDMLAFRLHHFLAFWFGRPEAMARQVEAVLPHWHQEMPFYAAMLACRCFAHEELGAYTIAENAGRRAIDLDPADLWAAHAVAHVLEMQGRRSEGINWLTSLEPHWTGGNHFMHHLWWHRGLYHYERGEHEEVLRLYDTRYRNLGSDLTKAVPDLYVDFQNASSMLFRLERVGVDVGNRWTEIADKAEARIGDHRSAFTQVHLMMALTATKRFEAGERMLASMRGFAASGTGLMQTLVAKYSLPLCEGLLHRARGAHLEACRSVRPALGGMYQMGGSHAQQDVLEQLYLDCAERAGSNDDVRLLIERVTARHPVAPDRRAGYRRAAARLQV